MVDRPDSARRTGPAVEAMYQFMLWLVTTVEKFPRSQKFLIGDRIQGTARGFSTANRWCTLGTGGIRPCHRPKRFSSGSTHTRPGRFPVDRLAQYMREFACLLGEPASVHFDKLIEGSACIVARIEHAAVIKVEERIARAARGDAPADARQAVKVLDELLAGHNTDGALSDADGAALLPFAGATRQQEPAFGSFNQGRHVGWHRMRVGGRGDPVPVMLETRDGFETHCTTSRSIAKRLAAHLFVGEVRCSGLGRWHRNGQGNWLLDRFTITGFEPLDDRPLGDIVRDLQLVEGNAWRESEDVWKEVADLRGDGDP